MPLVIIQTPTLTSTQKKRIGDRIINALHGEGVPASSVVVLFQPDASDIYLDGGLVHEMEIPEAPVFHPRHAASSMDEDGMQEEGSRSGSRRSRQERDDLKKNLLALLQQQGALSSFKAQEDLGLRDCDWAPATLRRFFAEMEKDGLITKQGQKRGTRYVWKGQANAPTSLMPKLVKRNEDADAEA